MKMCHRIASNLLKPGYTKVQQQLAAACCSLLEEINVSHKNLLLMTDIVFSNKFRRTKTLGLWKYDSICSAQSFGILCFARLYNDASNVGYENVVTDLANTSPAVLHG